MLLDYADCTSQYANAYQINQAIQENRLYRIERGIYATTPHVSELAIIQKKYPKAIFTLDSAFYYHGLTTDIPDLYHIATPAKSARLRDKRIRQVFVNDSIFTLGQVEQVHEGTPIRIYNKERMLIELLRYKNKLPYDYYKEILRHYRAIIDQLDIEQVQEYAAIFPKSDILWKRLDEEVF